MRLIFTSAVFALATAGLSACNSPDAEAPPVPPETPQAAVPDAEPPAPPASSPPVASMAELMRGTTTFAAEAYWGSVSVIVDENGVTENAPETDDEWLEVWAAAMTLAESGNLLMMPPRAYNVEAWTRLSEALVDTGVQAAQAAAAKDSEAVLEVGEYIYNVCLECHQRFVPRMPDL
jgi:hypothetical protein